MQYFFGTTIFLTSLFLILLILIQRGRGGGLAGALGGMGGQSAFGTKAGDLFTRITIGVAAVWILLSVAAIAVLNQSNSVFGQGSRSIFSTGSDSKSPAGTSPAGTSPADITPAGTTPDGSTGSTSLSSPAKNLELETGSKQGDAAVPGVSAVSPQAETPAAKDSETKAAPQAAPATESSSAPGATKSDSASPAGSPATPAVISPSSPDKK